jgi:hypothetical protein
MPSLVNLTPHPIRIYPIDTPDRIDPADHEPILVLPPSPDHPPARLGQIDLGTQNLGLGVPVEYVEFVPHGGTVNPLPERLDGTWYVVALVVAIALAYRPNGRGDLLVPYLEVRNLEGTMIGCKMLARPV